MRSLDHHLSLRGWIVDIQDFYSVGSLNFTTINFWCLIIDRKQKYYSDSTVTQRLHWTHSVFTITYSYDDTTHTLAAFCLGLPA